MRTMKARELETFLELHDADLEVGDEVSGKTPLFWAVAHALPDHMRILLDAGANIAARNELGQTPLHVALMFGRVAVINMLIERGAPLEARDNNNGTPLMMAAWQTASYGLEKMLEHDVDIFAVNDNGETAYDIALSRKGEDDKPLNLHGAAILKKVIDAKMEVIERHKRHMHAGLPALRSLRRQKLRINQPRGK